MQMKLVPGSNLCNPRAPKNILTGRQTLYDVGERLSALAHKALPRRAINDIGIEALEFDETTIDRIGEIRLRHIMWIDAQNCPLSAL
ncbi:hypothetical protein BL243_18255 [Ralstonia solanacearum]|nr:hypothetical protein BL243_18255 [Ralstonia solanacearum]